MDTEAARVTVNTGNGGEPIRPSYWLDACEDIGDFVDFSENSAAPAVVANGNGCNQEEVSDFFGGIDHILDSIKSGAGLPDSKGNGVVSNGNVEELGASGVSSGSIGNNVQSAGRNSEAANGEGRVVVVASPAAKCNQNGSIRSEGNGRANRGVRERESNGEERCPKRVAVDNGRNERYSSGRVQYQPRERNSTRKRPRDPRDDVDRRDRDRDRDRSRRRESYGSNRRDSRDWEAKGYWERDKLGSNELVFRVGAYEPHHKKEEKVANDKNQECNGKDVKMSEEQKKEKIPEERARQYQLDVLEQAKKSNTIAFLETGAGKTLIAILLMQSVCNDFQKKNKKMLSVFLVPKVPLVYQVMHA